MERPGDARQCMDFVGSFPGKRGKGHGLSVIGPEYWVNSGPPGDEFPACYDRGVAFILPILDVEYKNVANMDAVKIDEYDKMRDSDYVLQLQIQVKLDGKWIKESIVAKGGFKEEVILWG